jgi:flagellar assembly protein FliH
MIIKANSPESSSRLTAAELVELAAPPAATSPHEDRLRDEAARIIAEAKHQAERLRREAIAEGRREGEQAAREELARRHAEQWATLAPAFEKLVAELRDARQAWLDHWEKSAVGLSVAIARRVLRRELTRQPDVALDLVREALELAAGSDRVRVVLSPADHESLGPRVADLAKELSGLGTVEVAADAAISPGGCRVETRFGQIDQQFEAQLARIEEELV